MSKKQLIFLLVLSGIVIAGGIFYAIFYFKKNNNKPIACTMEAKICPDGSSVGRVSPNCDFAPCPELVGNDRDEHGCIGSAGYSWCEAKQKCLRPWEEECSAADLNSIFKLNEKVAGTKIYYSSKLGVGFTYLPNQKDANFTVGVTEVENKIYVHRTNEKPETGQSIEVFDKDPGLNLEEAIKEKFLKGYSAADCFVEYNKTNEQGLTNYVAAEISFPPGNNPDEPWWQNADKCPKDYSKTNGIQYFLMNKDYPNKFIFVRIGQYSITSDGAPATSNGLVNWSHAIRILDPALIINSTDWLTYTDAQNSFTFRYPKDFGANVWRASTWPPTAKVVPAGGDIIKQGCPDIQGSAPESSQVVLNNMNFTLYKESQGAAGSTYTTYCYAAQKEQNYYVIEFVIRYTTGCGENCGPYCGTKYETECTNFNKVNEVEKPIEEMVSTLKFK